MSQCPDIVEAYLQCGKDKNYDILHLLSALDLSEVDTDMDYGQMTTMICYKTLYIFNGKYPFVLSFALVNDVSLNFVLGLPTLLAMGASIGLVLGLLSNTKLNREFPLDLQPPGKGLSEGATLKHYTHTISFTVSTNLLHHISAEGTSHPVYQSTPLDNIHVTDKFSKIKCQRS